MLAEFDTTTLIALAVALAAGAWFLAAAADNVIGRDGFGTLANAIILVAGACLGLFMLEHLHLPVYNPALRALGCVAGGFSCLALLSLLKAFANRLHY